MRIIEKLFPLKYSPYLISVGQVATRGKTMLNNDTFNSRILYFDGQDISFFVKVDDGKYKDIFSGEIFNNLIDVKEGERGIVNLEWLMQERIGFWGRKFKINTSSRSRFTAQELFDELEEIREIAPKHYKEKKGIINGYGTFVGYLPMSELDVFSAKIDIN